MRVLIVIDSFYDGGAEMFAIRLANSLRKQCTVYFMELNPFDTVTKAQLKFLSKEILLFQAGKNLMGKIFFEEIFLYEFILDYRKDFRRRIYFFTTIPNGR